ncbi:MAG: hypothetical protein K2Y18_09040 [Alphaproteobacteria bacterium]|nr:hypothetical protein [Alphaproteobacteria bacterium]
MSNLPRRSQFGVLNRSTFDIIHWVYYAHLNSLARCSIVFVRLDHRRHSSTIRGNLRKLMVIALTTILTRHTSCSAD